MFLNMPSRLKSYNRPSQSAGIHRLNVGFIVQLQRHVWFCDPMDCNTPYFPVLHYLPEFSQTHVYWVGDAIQLSHPLLSLSPPTFNLSQHQGLFQWVSLHQVAKVSASASVLPMNTQDCSLLGWTGWISLQSKWLSRVFSNTAVQKHQFFGTQLSSQYNSHINTWPLGKP